MAAATSTTMPPTTWPSANPKTAKPMQNAHKIQPKMI
jgi:hypothetical protein